MIKRISKITVVLLTLLLIFGSVPVHAAAPFDIAEDLQPVLRGTSYLLTVSYASDSVKEDIVWTSDDPSGSTQVPEQCGTVRISRHRIIASDKTAASPFLIILHKAHREAQASLCCCELYLLAVSFLLRKMR